MPKKIWWKEAVVYQIYPISFQDSDGDGKGDLRGILSRLDYLSELGIDVIWICPIYKSPNHDNGYDISDYYAIMDEFGTMEDFDELLHQAHERGIKIMMDLVLNHTSDEHPWFTESRSSKDNPKRDYYIWRTGKNGGYPNNWESYFSGSVWKYDKLTDEYYMHLYSEHQPDLNWENEEMVGELYRMVEWWLKKGVDGFRFDAIAHIVKAEGLPDAHNPDKQTLVRAYQLFSNLEQVHVLLRMLNEKVLERYPLMTVGETSGLGPEQALDYVGDQRHELNMVFQFEHMFIDAQGLGTEKWKYKSWTLVELKKIMSSWQTVLHQEGWNANYLNNHDQPRALSRFANDGQYRVESAKMLATFTHMLEGTPYIYQGEEIGMTNIAFPSIDDYRDVETLNYYEQQRKIGEPEEQIMAAIWRKSRDNARTPMQWNAGPAAGFTDGEPWMKINDNYTHINAEAERNNPNSIFHYYRKLIALRKQHEVIVYGEYKLLLPLDTELYVFARMLGQERLLVILNFFDRDPVFHWPDGEEFPIAKAELLLSNYEPVKGENLYALKLRPYEARVYKLTLK
ncbi:oligo-1,6-glucosidase [Paenibacillus polymyxa]|uniref:glycoside hydrolase family 13 protein n=1 Tax=Paenibacillus polymyxa TaxID=1406 RepID=UPI00042F6447|nr:alpha-glucosidase [Paenibacillus polymyxa]AHM64124.1 oligo-1,6-glucosidase [Paenibacillus polymyxa SQR-21]AIY09814.1 oligo-1,6-glucosidase [Paenibacillus polymyxa]